MKKCYNKSFLDPQKAFELLKEMEQILGESYFNTLVDYYEAKNKIEENRRKWQQQLKQNRIDEREHWVKRAKQLHNKSPRRDIVTASYFIRREYNNPMDLLNRNKSIIFEEFDSKMKKYMKEEILDELLIYIESVPELVGEESNKKK